MPDKPDLTEAELQAEYDKAMLEIAPTLDPAMTYEEFGLAVWQACHRLSAERVKELERERDGWKADAERYAGNADYWHSREEYWRARLARVEGAARALVSALENTVRKNVNWLWEPEFMDQLRALTAALGESARAEGEK